MGKSSSVPFSEYAQRHNLGNVIGKNLLMGEKSTGPLDSNCGGLGAVLKKREKKEKRGHLFSEGLLSLMLFA
jgi:hypothetical protein